MGPTSRTEGLVDANTFGLTLIVAAIALGAVAIVAGRRGSRTIARLARIGVAAVLLGLVVILGRSIVDGWYGGA
jgi:hypothetical protein